MPFNLQSGGRAAADRQIWAGRDSFPPEGPNAVVARSYAPLGNPWARRTFLFLGLALLLGVAISVPAQVAQEYQVKAVALWRLAQFTDWPTNALETAEDPIVIGVLGDNPFGDALEVAVRGETAHDRKLMVRYYRRGDDVRACHILFIAKSEASRVRRLTRTVTGALTVSDMEGFSRFDGGMVELSTEQGKIQLKVDLAATREAGLRLDARLLRMAEITRKP